MKQQLQKIIKASILLSFLALIGCTKDIYDDTFETNSSLKIKTVNFDEFKKNSSAFKQYNKLQEKKALALTSKTEIDTAYGFAVKTDEATYIEKDGYNSYTFEIYWPDLNDKNLKNLTFSLNETGKYDVYIVEYAFTKEELASMTQEQLDSSLVKYYYLDYESGEAKMHMEVCFEKWVKDYSINSNGEGYVSGEYTWVLVSSNCFLASSGGGGGDGLTDGDPISGTEPATSDGQSSGSLGGNSGEHVTTPTVCSGCPEFSDETAPCEQLKSLYERGLGKPNIKSEIMWLQTKVDEKKEYGVDTRKAVNVNGDMVYTSTQKTSGANFEVLLDQGTKYLGWLHSHPINGYGMFSFGDLKFLRSGYEIASDSRKSEVFTIIVCRDKTDPTKTNVYALKVNDIALLGTKVDAIWNKYSNITDERQRLEKIHEAQAEIYQKSNNQLEKSFLQQFQGSGISLYKADNSLTNWSKLELSTTPNTTLTVIQTPCN